MEVNKEREIFIKNRERWRRKEIARERDVEIKSGVDTATETDMRENARNKEIIRAE